MDHKISDTGNYVGRGISGATYGTAEIILKDDGTAAKEYLAYVFAQMLGVRAVSGFPCRMGMGWAWASVFIPDAEALTDRLVDDQWEWFFGQYHDFAHKMTAFDAFILNNDRNRGNIIIKNNVPYLIDHGLAFETFYPAAWVEYDTDLVLKHLAEFKEVLTESSINSIFTSMEEWYGADFSRIRNKTLSWVFGEMEDEVAEALDRRNGSLI